MKHKHAGLCCKCNTGCLLGYTDGGRLPAPRKVFAPCSTGESAMPPKSTPNWRGDMAETAGSLQGTIAIITVDPTSATAIEANATTGQRRHGPPRKPPWPRSWQGALSSQPTQVGTFRRALREAGGAAAAAHQRADHNARYSPVAAGGGALIPRAPQGTPPNPTPPKKHAHGNYQRAGRPVVALWKDGALPTEGPGRSTFLIARYPPERLPAWSNRHALPYNHN